MDKFFETRDTASDDDFYQLLGCSSTSTEEQISTEFRQLARKFHPDKACSEEDKAAAEKVFLKLEKAREVLMDREKRAKYDIWRSGGFKMVLNFEKWFEMQNRSHSSMHWAAPEKPVPALHASAEGSSGVNSCLDHSPTIVGASEPNTQLPTSLEDFRRGGERAGSGLRNFRNYSLN